MSQDDTIKTVMVLGARGNLAPYLIPSLSSAGFKVSILSRSPPPAEPSDPAITNVQSDYTLSSLISVFKGQDAIVSTIATYDVHIQRTIVDACVAAGVKRFLPSEFGSDTSVVRKEEKAGFLKWKANVLEYVREKEEDGLEWTAVYTGAWIDWLLQAGFLNWDLEAKSGTLYDSGNTSFTVSTISTVVRAVVSVLLKPSETRNQFVYANSFNLTQNTILEALERISGAKFEMDNMSLKELYERGERHVAEGQWEAGYSELVTATIYGGSELVNFREKAEKWNRILEIEETETFDEMIARVLACVEK